MGRKTILKPRLAAAPNTYRPTSDFSDVKFRIAGLIRYITEKAIWFRRPDYNPDRAQKLISSSVSRHPSTSNISSKAMHAFLSNLVSCIMCRVVLLRVVAWAWRRGQRVCLSRVAARDQRHASHVRDASKLSQSSVSSGRRRTRLNLSV